MGGQSGISSILYAIGQSASTLIIGNAVFPIDWIPGLFLLSFAVASIFSAKKILGDRYAVVLLAAILFGITLLVILRFGVEGRNAVFLYPIALVLITQSISRSTRWARLLATSALILLQISSVYGFVFHHNTAKGSYNTPFPQAISAISLLSRACPGKSYVFTFEPVLTYLVEEAGGAVSSPYAPSQLSDLSVRENDCIFVIRTFRGVPSPHLNMKYANKPLDADNFRKTRTIYLGYDRFHAIKTRVGRETFPEYYVTIDDYEVLHSSSVSGWYR